MNDRKDILDPERIEMEKREREWMDSLTRKICINNNRDPIKEKKKWVDAMKEIKRLA